MNFRILFFLLLFMLPIAAQQTEPIKIGLLIQDKNSLAAKQGAQLAVKLANDKGGLGGRPFQLITKDMEGPWGSGSKQAVDLIFEEEVWALLGSHDGRNAHLVEQAATKSTVVFISAWSSDPTLSQAFVPWFFNCVPTDRQQADALIEEIYSKRKIIKVAVISDQTYDSNQSLKSYLQRVKQTGKTEPSQFLYNNYTGDLEVLIDQINKAQSKAIILFCHPSVSLRIIRLMKHEKMSQPVFGSLSILNEDVLSTPELQEFDHMLLIPSLSTSISLNFHHAYRKTYGTAPGLVAAYAFDGMNTLIQAIRISGDPDREKIQHALSKIRHEGVTGLVEFDAKGNRLGVPVIIPTKVYD